MLPSLSALDVNGAKRQFDGTVVTAPQKDRDAQMRKMLSLAQDSEPFELGPAAISELLDEMSALYADITASVPLAPDETALLLRPINNGGWKPLVQWLVQRHPETLPDLHRNCTREWWTRRHSSPLTQLNLTREEDGSVVVDLWHARRGNDGPPSFKDFKAGHPTFFMGSLGEMQNNHESIEDYVGEAEHGEDDTIYVKRGRFRFKPLLWFDNKNIDELRADAIRANVIATLVKQHVALQNTDFDMNQMSNDEWKKILYYRTERFDIGDGQIMKFALELRLDNNCVDNGDVAVEHGFGGTLAVDISGFAAMLPPGKIKPGAIDTESVVLWNPAGSLVNEDPWIPLTF